MLSWHAADDDGEPTARSLFVDDVCDLFDERPRRARACAGRSAPSSGAPATARRGRARRAGLAARCATSACSPSCASALWSASSLEAWIGCPVRWFVERLLAPGALEPDPEPLARGGARARRAARHARGPARARPARRALTPATLGLARELLASGARSATRREHPLSVAPERLPGARRRLRADLERYLEHAAELDEPARAERTWSSGSASTPADERGRGERRCRRSTSAAGVAAARADRPGRRRARRGEAVVYDYKGRIAPPRRRKWIARRAACRWRCTCAPSSSCSALRVAGGFYQPLSGADLRARGVLDGDSGVELDCVRGDAREPTRCASCSTRRSRAAREAAARGAARASSSRGPQTCAFDGRLHLPHDLPVRALMAARRASAAVAAADA